MPRYEKQPIRNPKAYNAAIQANYETMERVKRLMQTASNNLDRFEYICANIQRVEDCIALEQWARDIAKFPNWQRDITRLQVMRGRQLVDASRKPEKDQGGSDVPF